VDEEMRAAAQTEAAARREEEQRRRDADAAEQKLAMGEAQNRAEAEAKVRAAAADMERKSTEATRIMVGGGVNNILCASSFPQESTCPIDLKP
jgi:triosephosphate isomerase